MTRYLDNPLAILSSASLLLLLSALMLKAEPQSPDTQAPKGDPLLGERITGGIVFEGKLWLRGVRGSRKDFGGGLISLSLADGSRQVHFEGGVLDAKRIGRDLCIMRWPSPQARNVLLSVLKKGHFEDFATLPSSEKDQPIALVNGVSGPVVLSVQSVRTFSADWHDSHQIKLKGRLRGGFQEIADSPSSSDSVYIGFNTGEWGGGLQRVDLRTGIVSDMERRDTKELCAGPLNSDCDPVTGVIPDPLNKDCVLAAVGLAHMASHGRILRVCGKDVNLIFEKSYSVDIGDRKFEETEPFFGLVPAEDGRFWGITSRALYRFGADGTKAEEYPLPKLKPFSGIFLSRELPGVIVIRTDANWAVSVSGYTPLVIPLEGNQPESK